MATDNQKTKSDINARNARHAAASARRAEIAARERDKRSMLQAALDALKPKTAALKRYQARYLDRVKGAKAGANLGAMGGFSA